MQTVTVDTISETGVVDQAGDIAAAAVRAMLTTALRGATSCRCHTCRAHAATTYDWAVAFLRVEPTHVSQPRRPSPFGVHL